MNIFKINTAQDLKLEKVKNFYSKNPFPGYQKKDNKHTIYLKGNKNILAKKIKTLFNYKKKILEVGSGTCQLSNYFALGTNNQVYAFDATLRSLEFGNQFAIKNNIKNINFIHGNILDDKILKKEFFDFIWCNGVLHHTTDPLKGFQNCLKALKKDGLILLGLYNKYGRFFTNIKQVLFKIFGKKIIKFLDPFVYKNIKNDDQIEAWIQDQYNHPLEKSYSFRTIYDWFQSNNVSLLCTLPQTTPLSFNDLYKKDLKKKINYKLNKNYFLKELQMIFNFYGQDGGLFIFLGQKNES